MKEERYHIALDDYEHGVVIRALNDSKTELMHEGMERSKPLSPCKSDGYKDAAYLRMETGIR